MEIALVVFLIFMVVAGIITEISKRSSRAAMDASLIPTASDDTPRLSAEAEAAFLARDKNSEAMERAFAKSAELNKRRESGEISDAEWNAAVEPVIAAMKETLERDERYKEELVRLGHNPQLPMPVPDATPEGDVNEGFEASAKYLGKDGAAGIALDSKNHRFALLTPLTRDILSFGQLVSSEVCIDSETIVKTDRVEQIGGALVGGFVTGGVGALVLAMGAKKKQIDTINRVELKILTSGTNRPVHKVLFYERGSFNSPRLAIEQASEWHDRITVAIREANESKQATLDSVGGAATKLGDSIADEIEKLARLKERGLISDEEYRTGKARILR